MKTNNVIIWVMVAMITISAILVFITGPVKAEDAPPDVSAISAKLDEVLSNQKAILEGIASVKEELRVVKIRITQQQ